MTSHIIQKNMKIIGLSGKMGCGKNYIAEQLLYPHFKNQYNILIIGFGDLIKAELYARDTSLSYDELYDKKTFETRQKLQIYGTENGRDKYHDHIWIRGLDIQIETFYRRCSGDALIIICDVRFKEEYEYIIKKGGKLVRINSPKRTHDRYIKETDNDETKMNLIKNHKSEIELDDFPFANTVENDYESIANITYLLEE